MRKTINTKNAPAPVGNVYSQGVVAEGRLVFTAGQLGLDPAAGKLVSGGVQAETRRALENVKAIVEAAGSSMDRVVKVTVLLADIGDFSAMNEIYKTFFPDAPPARTAFEVGRLPLDALVEIEAVAVIDQV